MNRIFKYLSVIALLALSACGDMNIPPKNTVTDDDLLTSSKGMQIYLARLYSQMPWEDFKYMAQWGFEFNGWLGTLGIDGCGEAMNRDDVFETFRSERTPFWRQAFVLLHDANHLIEALPEYGGNFSAVEMNYYLGQAYFVRAYTFYQMARRFGGIPLVTHTIAYPAEADKLEVARSSEEETWDQICRDFDTATELLPETSSLQGLPNKYAALSFKAEAML